MAWMKATSREVELVVRKWREKADGKTEWSEHVRRSSNKI